MGRAGILRRLGALVQPVVADHLRHAQPVVGEDAFAAGRLRLAVLLDIAPALHGLLVAPDGQRQELARLRQALEALDGDEAVHLLQHGLEPRRRVEVRVLAPRGRHHFEYDRDHGFSMRSRNVRSSRRIRRFSSANANAARPSGSALIRVRYASYAARLSNEISPQATLLVPSWGRK